MAELLIKAISASHADPEKSERGCYRKGDIVVVMPDGHEWGAQEGLPTFVRVRVPGVAASAVADRIESWRRVIDYEIVQTNAALDGARFRIFQQVPGVATPKGITRAQVEAWINRWGGSVVSEATNEVRFDITIQNIYKSGGFWVLNQNYDPPSAFGVVITETAYTQATGEHIATININASSVTPQQAQARLIERGGEVISFAAGVATVRFMRDAVRSMLMAELKRAADKTLVRRRYYFAAADVDAAIAAGGEITVTPAQVAAKILDKAA